MHVMHETKADTRANRIGPTCCAMRAGAWRRALRFIAN